MPPKPGERRRDPITGRVAEYQADGSWKFLQTAPARGTTVSTDAGEQVAIGPGGQVSEGGAPHVGVTLREAASRLERTYPPETIAALRSGDVSALTALRPSDQAEVERTLSARASAAQRPTAHAPIRDRDPGLAGELDAAATEHAPVTRSRSARPTMENTHTPLEQAAGFATGPLAGIAHGSSAATLGLTNIPTRALMPARQRQVEEAAATSPGTTTAAGVVASLMPQSFGARLGMRAAAAVPTLGAAKAPTRAAVLRAMNLGEAAPVATPAATGLRGVVARGLTGTGRALASSAAVSGAQGAGQAVSEMQQGASAGEALPLVKEQIVQDLPVNLAMYPIFAGLQGIARRSVDALRQSPDLGPDVVALERAGLTTQVPVPGVRSAIQAERAPGFIGKAVDEALDSPNVRPGKLPFTREKRAVPEGNEIAAAQREQAQTGEDAADITNRRAGTKALETLGNEQSDLRARHAEENATALAAMQGQRVSTEPIAKHMIDLVKKGSGDWMGPLPGKAGDVRSLRRELDSVMNVRWAKPGEQGIDVRTAERMGFMPDGPAPGATETKGAMGRREPAEFETIPPPGKARRGAGGGAMVVLEPRQLSAEQLETSIRKFDELAGEARNVKKLETGKAAESIAAVMRQMRNQFDALGTVPGRGTDSGRKVGRGGEITSDYSRMKARHHEELNTFEGQLKAFGLNERIDEIDPADLNLLKPAMAAIAQGDVALQRLAPNNFELQRELRIAAAHRSYDRLYGREPQGATVSTSGPGLLSTQGLRLAIDPAARFVAGSGLSEAGRRGLAGSRSSRIAGQAPPELVDQFLGMIGLGGSEEER